LEEIGETEKENGNAILLCSLQTHYTNQAQQKKKEKIISLQSFIVTANCDNFFLFSK